MKPGRFTQERRRARTLQLRHEPSHPVRVPPGPDGRPGESLLAPSLPLFLGRLARDGTRWDLDVLIGKDSHLRAVCLSPSTAGSAEESAENTCRSMVDTGIGALTVAPHAVQLLGENAVQYEMALRSGRRLVETKLVHEGWVFAVGLDLVPGERNKALALGHRTLETWTWLAGTTESDNQPPGEPVWIRVAASVGIHGDPQVIWALLRRPELSALSDPDVVSCHRLPDSPYGVGERHLTHYRVRPGMTMRTEAVLVEVEPYSLLVLREETPRQGATSTWRLADGGDQVVLTAEAHVPLPDGLVDTAERREELTADLGKLLQRLKRRVESGWTPPA